MKYEELFRHGTTAVRRLTLNPGKAMAWHRDPHHRVAVVLEGDVLEIEFRIPTSAFVWKSIRDKPIGNSPARALTAINIGQKTYRQITIFLLDRPDDIPQPREE